MTGERDYYVTLRRAGRVAWLAGPFATHFDALVCVERAVALANELDPFSYFDPYGTCSLPRNADNPEGKLNLQLGLDFL